MRLVHSQFSKAEGCNFIDEFSKIKGTLKLNSFAVRSKSYYVNIKTGKSHGNNVKYSLLKMTKTKVSVS